MRFMVMVKATKESEAGAPPSLRIMEEMGKFNEELMKAGVMLAGEGLQPSSKGARVKFSGTKRTVTDGPFTEGKEHLGGFTIVKAPDLDSALEWGRRLARVLPLPIEVRPFADGTGD